MASSQWKLPHRRGAEANENRRAERGAEVNEIAAFIFKRSSADGNSRKLKCAGSNATKPWTLDRHAAGLRLGVFERLSVPIVRRYDRSIATMTHINYSCCLYNIFSV